MSRRWTAPELAVIATVRHFMGPKSNTVIQKVLLWVDDDYDRTAPSIDGVVSVMKHGEDGTVTELMTKLNIRKTFGNRKAAFNLRTDELVNWARTDAKIHREIKLAIKAVGNGAALPVGTTRRVPLIARTPVKIPMQRLYDDVQAGREDLDKAQDLVAKARDNLKVAVGKLHDRL